jgi:hypothetical protein
MRGFAQVERGDQGRRQSCVRRERPRLGRRTQEEIRTLLVELERVVFDDLGQLPLGHVGLHRPGPFGHVPCEEPRGTRTAEHQAWVGQDVDRAAMEGLSPELRPNVQVHAALHCVANKRPNPANYCMLYETGRGRRRLFRRGDVAHPY